METIFSYTEKGHGFFSSDERKFITKVRKLKKQFPDLVRIIAEPEDNYGCIYCEMPTDWFTIRATKKYTMTEEEKHEFSDRAQRIFHVSR